MTNNENTHSTQKTLPRRSNTAKLQQPRSGVWQDNPTLPPARTATKQPAPPKKGMRPTLKDVFSTRARTSTGKSRKTVHLTLWVKPVVKAELERIAEQEGLSVSATGAAFLEQALQQNLHSQHAALLDTIIDKAIGKHMRSYSIKLAMLLVRVSFASEQTRSLVTNILGRQPGITPEVLNQILDGSSRAAKGKITYKTPQLESLIEEVEQWFTEKESKHNG